MLPPASTGPAPMDVTAGEVKAATAPASPPAADVPTAAAISVAGKQYQSADLWALLMYWYRQNIQRPTGRYDP